MDDDSDQKDGVLVMEIHDKAPYKVIAVYEEADPGLFAVDADDNDDDDGSSRPRSKKRQK